MSGSGGGPGIEAMVKARTSETEIVLDKKCYDRVRPDTGLRQESAMEHFRTVLRASEA
jgi:dihydrofolate reductase